MTKRDNARRSFQSSDMRDLFDSAVRHGWKLKRVHPHVVMHSPDGEYTLVLSTTAVGTRSINNSAAPLRRWLRQQEK